MERIAGMDEKIDNLVKENPEVERIIVVSKDGLIVSARPGMEDDELFAAKTVLFLDPINKMLKELNMQKGELSIFRTRDKYLLVHEAENIYVIMVAKKNAPIGFLLYDIEEIGKML